MLLKLNIQLIHKWKSRTGTSNRGMCQTGMFAHKRKTFLWYLSFTLFSTFNLSLMRHLSLVIFDILSIWQNNPQAFPVLGWVFIRHNIYQPNIFLHQGTANTVKHLIPIIYEILNISLHPWNHWSRDPSFWQSCAIFTAWPLVLISIIVSKWTCAIIR